MKKLIILFAIVCIGLQAKSQDVQKALYEAILTKNLENVKKVVEEFKADVNVAYDNKAVGEPYPLNMSCFIGSLEITEYLISKGADPNKENRFGATALSSLVQSVLVDENSQKERLAIYNLIKPKITDINNTEKSGKTALSHAAYYGHTSIVVALLLEKEIEVDGRKNGMVQTALMCAADRGNFDIVKKLHEAGADPSEVVKIATSAGTFNAFTAAELAKNKNHMDVYAYLKSAKKIKRKK